MNLSLDLFAGLSFVDATTGWAAGPDGRIAKFNGDLPTAVLDRVSEIPQAFELSQNYPNPFNPSTTIQFTLARHTNVELKVFDLLGREVAILVDEALGSGTHEVVFDADDLPSGIYIYRIQTGEFVQARKLTILK